MSLNERRSRRGGRPVARHPWKAPRRSTVPKVFDCGVVVQVEAVDQLLAAEFGGVGIPDIRVIAGKVVFLRTVSRLHEASDMAGPCSREKQRYVLGQFETAIL